MQQPDRLVGEEVVDAPDVGLHLVAVCVAPKRAEVHVMYVTVAKIFFAQVMQI